MSLVGNLWKRFRSSPAQVKRARRLFMEPLEDRNLLAAQLTVTKTDSFTSQMPPQSVRAGEQNLLYSIKVQNAGDLDATTVNVIDAQPANTSNGSLTVASPPTMGGTATVVQNPSPTDDRAIGNIDVLHPGDFAIFSFQVAV